MSAREILAYAITHAPKGVKGGPYEADDEGTWGTASESLRPGHAVRWRTRPTQERVDGVLRHVREVHPHARVIRIVRKARPSEASAVEVLRAMVAWVDSKGGGFNAIIARARRVLAASGPDPSEMVRAVETLREQAFRGPARRTAALEALLDTFDAYRKAGGK